MASVPLSVFEQIDMIHVWDWLLDNGWQVVENIKGIMTHWINREHEIFLPYKREGWTIELQDAFRTLEAVYGRPAIILLAELASGDSVFYSAE